jgi:hypothetical protein
MTLSTVTVSTTTTTRSTLFETASVTSTITATTTPAFLSASDTENNRQKRDLQQHKSPRGSEFRNEGRRFPLAVYCEEEVVIRSTRTSTETLRHTNTVHSERDPRTTTVTIMAKQNTRAVETTVTETTTKLITRTRTATFTETAAVATSYSTIAGPNPTACGAANEFSLYYGLYAIAGVQINYNGDNTTVNTSDINAVSCCL